MFHDFSQDFLKYKDPSYINLNNGTLGLSPDIVIDQQKAELELMERNTSYSLGSSWARLAKIQEQLATFLKAKSEDLFLRPNITLVLNELILGLKLPENSEILTSNFEYGAIVNILKLKSQKERHSLRIADFSFLLEESITEDQVVEKIVSLISAQTKLVLVSHVYTGNGLCLPIRKLAKALRQRDIYLIVDGAHAPGLINLNIQNDFEDLDFYSGNLHKWVMGPKGTAFGWVHPRLQEQTSPLFASWTTFPEVPEVMKYFSAQGSFASRMLWAHSQSFPAYFALESTFKYWQLYGADFIYSEIKKRAEYLEKTLLEAGLKPLKSVQNPLGSALLSYDLQLFPKAQFEHLFLKGSNPLIQVGLPHIPGYRVLRLTPHIHNTQKDLDIAASFLRTLTV